MYRNVGGAVQREVGGAVYRNVGGAVHREVGGAVYRNVGGAVCRKVGGAVYAGNLSSLDSLSHHLTITGVLKRKLIRLCRSRQV